MSGRVVVITGAAGGIGRALCAAFLGLGDTVYAFDRAGDGLAAMVGEFGSPRLFVRTADVTNMECLRIEMGEAAGRHGRIDVAIINAGGVASELQGGIVDGWKQDVDLNLTGSAFTAEAVRPHMEARGGAIVFIGSVNGLQYFGHPAYSAAKAGLIAHTRSLACLLGPKNIRVNLLAPGTVLTPAWKQRLQLDSTLLDKVTKWYPLGRICRPDDVADVATFLASDAARMITGVTLPVDGGLTAGNFVFASDIS